jgi:hypothetical protein
MHCSYVMTTCACRITLKSRWQSGQDQWSTRRNACTFSVCENSWDSIARVLAFACANIPLSAHSTRGILISETQIWNQVLPAIRIEQLHQVGRYLGRQEGLNKNTRWNQIWYVVCTLSRLYFPLLNSYSSAICFCYFVKVLQVLWTCIRFTLHHLFACFQLTSSSTQHV